MLLTMLSLLKAKINANINVSLNPFAKSKKGVLSKHTTSFLVNEYVDDKTGAKSLIFFSLMMNYINPEYICISEEYAKFRNSFS